MHYKLHVRLGQMESRAAAMTERHVPGLIVPVLFALLMYVAIRQHSWSPISTLPLVTSYFLGASAAIFWAALVRKQHVSVPLELRQPARLLVVSVFISLLISPNLERAAGHLMLYLSIIAVASAMYLQYRDVERIPLAAFCAGIALVHLPFAAEVILWIRDEGPDFLSRGVSVPNFSHVRQFGEMGFVAAVCGTALAVLSPRWGLSAFLLTGGALFGIIAMGSRGALLCWMLFTLLLVFLSPSRMRVMAIGVGALLVAGGLVWYLHTSGLMETPNVIARLVQTVDSGGDGFDSGRKVLWRGALLEIVSHPLFGQGPEAYMTSGCCVRSVRQPHNLVLQFLMEFGLIGCGLVLVICHRALALFGGPERLMAGVRASEVGMVLGAAIAAYIAYGMIDGVFYHPMPMLFFALLCGLFGAAVHHRRQHGATPA